MKLEPTRDNLTRELKRLEDLSLLRSKGVSMAVSILHQIDGKLADPKVGVRDLNRAAEVVTKIAVTAAGQLDRSGSAELERRAPVRNVVVIILESNIPDERKGEMLSHVAAEWGDDGPQVVLDAVEEIEGEERARELLAIEP